MTKNPLLNALAAFLYIVSIAVLMNTFGRMAPKQDTIFAPIAFLSLFTLSAAIMAYLFCFQPIQLYFGKQKNAQVAAITLFLQTVGAFAVVTALSLALAFSGVVKY